MDTQTPQDTPENDVQANDVHAKADEYMAGWKRAMADYANLKRETDRERNELSKFAAARVITQLLPLYENLCKAGEHMPASLAEGAAWTAWAQGVSHITAQFSAFLTHAGVQKIDSIGPFDPLLHEAVMTEEREGAESGSVVSVLEPGYRLHERVLRPAKVVVAK